MPTTYPCIKSPPATIYTLEESNRRTYPKITPTAPIARGRYLNLPPEIDFLSRKNPQIGEKIA